MSGLDSDRMVDLPTYSAFARVAASLVLGSRDWTGRFPDIFLFLMAEMIFAADSIPPPIASLNVNQGGRSCERGLRSVWPLDPPAFRRISSLEITINALGRHPQFITAKM